MEGVTPDDRSARARILRHVLHDLANVFTCILAAASHRPSDAAEAEKHLAAIGTAALLGRDLLTALRAIPEPGSVGPTRVQRVVGSSALLLRCVAEPCGVVVTTVLDDVVVALPGHELQEIVINLGLNAIEAMPAGGTLTITAALAGDRVELVVADNGEGVDPGVLDNPSSSKGPLRGSGLASIARVLDRAGGTIDVTSDAAGTRFVIGLPC